MALEWVCSDLTIIKRKETRKRDTISRLQPGTYGKWEELQ